MEKTNREKEMGNTGKRHRLETQVENTGGIRKLEAGGKRWLETQDENTGRVRRSETKV